MISVIWVSVNIFTSVQLQITTRNSTLKSLLTEALIGGVQAAGIIVTFTCFADKHGLIECDKVTWK